MTDAWIFGYGSLIWRPAFVYQERCPAFVRGWQRRLWQGSTDHRGTPGFPGRVATLLPCDGARCWGMAFRVPPDSESGILALLDEREQGGYERRRMTLHMARGNTYGSVYVATPDNPNFLGAAPPGDMARQIFRARGPSGTNLEYLFELERALRNLTSESDEVFVLAEELRRLSE